MQIKEILHEFPSKSSLRQNDDRRPHFPFEGYWQLLKQRVCQWLMWPVCLFPGQAQQPNDDRYLFLWQLGKRCARYSLQRTWRFCWPLPGIGRCTCLCGSVANVWFCIGVWDRDIPRHYLYVLLLVVYYYDFMTSTFTGWASQNVSTSKWQLWRIDPSTAPLRPTYSHVSHCMDVPPVRSLKSASGCFRFLVPPSGTTCLSTSHLRRH